MWKSPGTTIGYLTSGLIVWGLFMQVSKIRLLVWGFYTFTTKNMERKKIISIRFELFKMFKNWYTQEQMQEFVKWAFDRWEVDLNEIVEALVDSRFEELVLSRKIEKVVDALRS